MRFSTLKLSSYLTIFQSYLSRFTDTSHFYILCNYSNLEIISYRTKYSVYFEENLIQTKFLRISKTILVDS